jgi:methionyl-tRNA formyltransferase
MNILFMGSAAFAVPTLQALVCSSHKVIEVVTQPDKPAGRGRHLTACPAAQAAQEAGLPLFQPRSVKSADALEHFAKLQPDLIIVVAYGKILPRALLDLPPQGCINVHASLLPKFRGAAPINWAIANGERETGVTTMRISEELDAGDILLARATPIGEEETASELHDRLALLGAELLLETIAALKARALVPMPQDHARATYAPLLKKEDGHIDWAMPAREIANRVRGFTPWPGAFCMAEGGVLRIHAARAAEVHDGVPAGTILETSPRLLVACGEGALEIMALQSEGGRRMAAQDFLRGHKLQEGTVLR